MTKIRIQLPKDQLVAGIERLQDSSFTSPPHITIFPENMGKYPCLLVYQLPTTIDDNLAQYLRERVSKHFQICRDWVNTRGENWHLDLELKATQSAH